MLYESNLSILGSTIFKIERDVKEEDIAAFRDLCRARAVLVQAWRYWKMTDSGAKDTAHEEAKEIESILDSVLKKMIS